MDFLATAPQVHCHPPRAVGWSHLRATLEGSDGSLSLAFQLLVLAAGRQGEGVSGANGSRASGRSRHF